MLAGGGFGRRANPVSDYVVEACEVARQVKVPVKVVWTREGRHPRRLLPPDVRAPRGGRARRGGKLVAWNHTIVGPSIIAGTPFEPMMVKDGIDPTSVEGVSDMPYEIPNLNVTLHTIDAGVPLLWWRSVGHSHTGFVVESMMDELAAAAGKDPVEFRRGLMGKHPKALRALDLARRNRAGARSFPRAARAASRWSSPSAAPARRWRRSRSRAASPGCIASSRRSIAASS
jgi:isoquinoline 1-oxidoreductase beta subunit